METPLNVFLEQTWLQIATKELLQPHQYVHFVKPDINSRMEHVKRIPTQPLKMDVSMKILVRRLVFSVSQDGVWELTENVRITIPHQILRNTGLFN